MTATPKVMDDGQTVTVRVPISIRSRGGRKLVLAPDGSSVTPAPVRRRVDNTMVKAIARAFRWREMPENGTYATIVEIAATEEINESYVGRVLRLTLLAPDIVEAILSGRQPAKMTLPALMQPLPIDWQQQRTITEAPRKESEEVEGSRPDWRLPSPPASNHG